MTAQSHATQLHASYSLTTRRHHNRRSLLGIRLAARLAAQLGLSLGIAISGLTTFSQPSLSAEDASEEELYALCSKYPYNSQCEGYSIPVPLSSRSGKEGVCALNTGGMSVSDRCKVSIEGDVVSAYVEQGGEINAIGGERRTVEFSIPTTAINQLSYAEGESVNTGRIIANTLLWGILGAAMTQPDKVSQVQIEFFREAAISSLEGVGNGAEESFDRSAGSFEETEVPGGTLSDEAIAQNISEDSITSPVGEIADSPSQESNRPLPTNQFGDLTFETSRSDGQAVRDQLEGMTGLTPRISL